MTPGGGVLVRRTRPEDFPAIRAMSAICYPEDVPWTAAELASQRKVFPEGQIVAEDREKGRVAGFAASLIVSWDDYDVADSWRDFTDHGTFSNHDPAGRTLYGADLMVQPDERRRGIGSRLYAAREELVRDLGLERIRMGARLRNYAVWADRVSAEEYVERVVAGEIDDATLSFQLAHGFRVLAVVPDYLRRDPASLGWAAVVEWVPG